MPETMVVNKFLNAGNAELTLSKNAFHILPILVYRAVFLSL